MQSSARRAFPPSRLLRPSSTSSATGGGLSGRPRALSVGAEEAFRKRKMVPPTEGNLRTTSLESTGLPNRKQGFTNGSSCVDTRPLHTLGGRDPRELPTMKPSHMDRKRGVFLEHLKQKYPHHASAIMGHQDRLPDQSRSAQSTVGDQGDHLSATSFDSLDTMSEGGEPPQPFTRGSRSRASLPVVRSANQTKDRSLGVLHLQYGDETKQVRMPNEITSEDTIRALFVSAFPQLLSMEMLESPATAVYVRDESRNVYYELDDVRTIADHSWLKIFHRDQGQASSHSSRPSNGEARVQPFSREGHHILRQQSLPAAPTAHPALCRIPFGPRSSTAPAIPKDRVYSAPTGPVAQPCPSAILERRDVKPDEASGAVLTPLAEPVEHPNPHHHRPLAGGPYLSQATPADVVEQPGLYRQRSRRYVDSQLPSLGSRTPPASPHKAGDARLLELLRPHQVGALERAAPGRQSLRRDSSVEVGVKTQSGMATSPTSDLSMATSGDPQTRERMKAMEQQIASLTGLVQHALLIGPSATKEGNSEKPPKMASPVPSLGSEGGSPVPIAGSQGTLADTPATASCSPHLGASLAGFSRSVSGLRLQLQEMRRLQLQHQESLKLMLKQAEQEIGCRMAMVSSLPNDPVQRQRTLVEDERHKYLDVEESVMLQLRELDQYVADLKRNSTPGPAHQPITVQDLNDVAARLQRVGDALAVLQGEFPGLQARMRAVLRVEVEAVRFLKEEPHKLDSMLKRVKSLTETLNGLRSQATVNHLESSEPKAGGVLPEDVTMAVTSELVTAVEATVMAREPPPPVLSQESLQPIPVEESSQPIKVKESPEPNTVKESSQPILVLEPHQPIMPQESQSPLPESQNSVHSEVVPTSPVVIHRACSSPVHVQRSQQSIALTYLPSPPFTPPHCQEPTMAGVSPQNQESSPASQEPGNSDPNSFNVQPRCGRNTAKSRALSIEAAKKEWAEHQRTSEFDKILQEAQVTMMMSIPSLEVADKLERPKATPLPSQEEADMAQSVPLATTDTSPVEPTAETVAETTEPQTPNKSPPPPPPRRSHPLGSGLTTGRSGEVIYTTRKESAMPQENLDETHPPLLPKPNKTPPQLLSPPPIVASAIQEEEDEGDRIMAELQVLYYVTGQISQQHPSPGADQPNSRREGAVAPSQVHSVNSYRTPTGLRQLAAMSEHRKAEDQSHDPKVENQVQIGSSDSLAKNSGAQQELNPASSVPSGKVAECMQEGVTWTGGKVVREKPTGILMVSQISTDRLDSLAAGDQGHTVVLRSSRVQGKSSDEASASPVLASEVSSPASDNIAFMITDTKVQALSSGEYEQIVSTEGGNVQTIKVGESREMTAEEESGLGKKPVIIIFDEPMDIRSGYNRLSTIFECEEELDRMLADNRNTKVTENPLGSSLQVKSHGDESDGTTVVPQTQNYCDSPKVAICNRRPSGEYSVQAKGLEAEPVNDKLDLKKKFRLKFPKKKLTALSQAIRTGTKTGKKMLQVVVYEDEEEPDGTVKQFKEAKRFEIGCQGQTDSSETTSWVQVDANLATNNSTKTEELQSTSSSFQHMMDESSQKTFTRTDQTLKHQETSVSGMCSRPADGSCVEGHKTYLVESKEPVVKDTEHKGTGPPDRGVPPNYQATKAPHRKRPKPQLLPRPAVIPRSASLSQQNTNGASVTGRTSAATTSKPRVQPIVTEKTAKPQQLHDPQKQFRQANGSAKKVGWDTKAPPPHFPASKIPAFYPSSGKSCPSSGADSEATNLNSSPSSSKSSFPSNHRSLSPHIPSPCNGSLHLSSPSNSSQSQNGRPPSSSSPVSPPSLSQGGRTVRTIHTPSFTSYKLQSGSKSTLMPASTSRNMV